jgi:hypothetical protein
MSTPLIPANVANRAAAIITDALPEEIRVPGGPFEGNTINPQLAEPLADLLQLVIANVIASILDAGSERDVILEDENLSNSIRNQMRGWLHNA